MDAIFFIISVVTLGSAVLAVSLRNLVHCALALAMAFGGLAALYLKLNAQFVGFAQVLIYIGAIAILIVFTILLTRGSDAPETSSLAPGWITGLSIAGALGFVLTGLILSSRLIADAVPPANAGVTVRQLGEQLMTRFVLPLEVIGVLLTAALIGAVVLAMREASNKGGPQ